VKSKGAILDAVWNYGADNYGLNDNYYCKRKYHQASTTNRIDLQYYALHYTALARLCCDAASGMGFANL